MDHLNTYTAFRGKALLCQGALEKVALKVRSELNKSSEGEVLIFSDSTGEQMDFNLQGTEQEVRKRLEVFLPDKVSKKSAGPGRPKLGVVSREVSLLPRHWEWLENQSGGASVNIRKLVDAAAKGSQRKLTVKQSQEIVYKVMSVIAGDLPNYEEALRFLYRKNSTEFKATIKSWPKDVRSHVEQLANRVFD